MGSIVFTGSRDAAGGAIVRVNGRRLTPRASLKLRNHSPTGFEWGYGGSGPSQLALAILLHLYGQTFALAAYQDFKWDVISKLSRLGFTLTAAEIMHWRESYERRSPEIPA